MSKTVIFNDVHVKLDNLDILEKNFRELYHRFSKTSERKKYKLKFIGDWFDARSAVDFDVAMFSKEWIDAFDEIGCEFIAGNHDKKDLDKDISWLDIFDARPIQRWRPVGEGIVMYGLGYYRDKKYADRLKNIGVGINSFEPDKAKKKILLTHVGVDGFIHETGVKQGSFKEAGLDMVISGHYHNRCANTWADVPIIYTGSFYQANFGEDEDKGYAILDNRTLEIEYVKTDFPVYKNFYVTEGQLEKALKQIDNDKAENKRVVVQTGLKTETNLSIFEKEYKGIRFDFTREIEVAGKKVNLEFDKWCQNEGIEKPYYEKADLLLKK